MGEAPSTTNKTGDPGGLRSRVSGLKGQRPGPLDDGAGGSSLSPLGLETPESSLAIRSQDVEPNQHRAQGMETPISCPDVSRPYVELARAELELAERDARAKWWAHGREGNYPGPSFVNLPGGYQLLVLAKRERFTYVLVRDGETVHLSGRESALRLIETEAIHMQMRSPQSVLRGAASGKGGKK